MIPLVPMLVLHAVVSAAPLAAQDGNGAAAGGAGAASPTPGTATDPAAGSTAETAKDAPAAHDLIGIARAESERERAKIEERIGVIVADLRKSTDTSLGFITARQGELAQLGAAALPLAIPYVNHEANDPGSVNAGRNVAMALARLDAPGVRARFEELATKGTPFGRRNALYALALRGDPASVPVFKDRLADPDPDVVVQAIEGIGLLARDQSESLLTPFVLSKQDAQAAAAMLALARLDSPRCVAEVTSRLLLEIDEPEGGDDNVIVAALVFLEKHPDPDAVSVLERLLRPRNDGFLVQSYAAHALRTLGQIDSTRRKQALDALRRALAEVPALAAREIAKAMNDLGDDSGLKVVTVDLDRQIDRNPTNLSARMSRAQILLEFGKWKDANRDLREVQRNDKNQTDSETLNLALARSYAGMGRFADAGKYLGRLQRTALSDLPQLHPEFQPMVEDSRYEKLFAPADKP